MNLTADVDDWRQIPLWRRRIVPDDVRATADERSWLVLSLPERYVEQASDVINCYVDAMPHVIIQALKEIKSTKMNVTIWLLKYVFNLLIYLSMYVFISPLYHPIATRDSPIFI